MGNLLYWQHIQFYIVSKIAKKLIRISLFYEITYRIILVIRPIFHLFWDRMSNFRIHCLRIRSLWAREIQDYNWYFANTWSCGPTYRSLF